MPPRIVGFFVFPQGSAALSHLTATLVQSPFMPALESSPILDIWAPSPFLLLLSPS